MSKDKWRAVVSVSCCAVSVFFIHINALEQAGTWITTAIILHSMPLLEPPTV